METQKRVRYDVVNLLSDSLDGIQNIFVRVDTDLRTDGDICADEKCYLMKRKTKIKPSLEKLLGRCLDTEDEVYIFVPKNES